MSKGSGIAKWVDFYILGNTSFLIFVCSVQRVEENSKINLHESLTMLVFACNM